MTDHDMLNDFADRAVKGDGQFAIAYAIMRLAGEHRQLQENLTFGDANNPNRAHGTFEKIAMVLEDIAGTMEAAQRDAG